MKNQRLTIKNKKTGKPEIIVQKNLNRESFGFEFFVDSELDAYKAAYAYKDGCKSVDIGYSKSLETWVVTVYKK